MNSPVLNMLYGQPKARGFLERAVENPRGGYIFFGPDGIGKRTAAILFAAAVNPPSFSESIFSLTHPDVIPLFPFKREPSTGREAWLEEWGKAREPYVLGQISPDPNPSWVISIGRIRELRKEMKFPPRILKRRVALLFDFDRIREEGANAFLKTLEEPQRDTILILTTSRPFALSATIRSRCKLVRFAALADEVISERLLSRGYAEEDAEMATDVAFGSLKQALRYLEDPENYIAEPVLSFLEEDSASNLVLLDNIDRLSWRVGLDRVFFSFGLIFRWVLRARRGRLPHWDRLQGLVKDIASRISRDSLVHNIMLTEKMSARVVLNPTPSLFLYQYLTSLKFS